MVGGLLSGGCSALNPAFDVEGDSATEGETFDLTTTSSSSTSGEAGETLDQRMDLPATPELVCVPDLVVLIEGCLHAAELSKPMDEAFEPDEWFLHPVKSDMLIFCTSTPGGIGTNLWSGDAFLETLGAAPPGIDPAVAYFDHLCPDGGFEWCEGSVDEFRGEVMQACFEEFSAGFEFVPFDAGPAIIEPLVELRDMFLANDCAGRCERLFELYTVPARVAPTVGGDAVRERLETYQLSDAPLIVRFDDGYVQDAPFAMPYASLRSILGAEDGWIAVTFIDHGPVTDCDDFQHRAMIAVHHERHLLVKMIQSECLI